MRIINAMFGRGLGGIEQALLDYADALALAGNDILCLIHPQAKIRKTLEARGLPFKAIANFGAWDPVAIFRLRRLMMGYKPQACIAHGNRAVSLLAHARAAVPLIGALHNYKIKCDHLTAAFYPTADLLHFALQNCMPKERLYFVPNMVRIPAARGPRAPHSPPVIGAMGRMVAKKGFDIFVETLALLQSRNIAFRAVLAGDGPELPALRKRAQQKGLGDVLTFTGWVEDKQAFFDALDIFCLPSLHEPFGIVLLEAMAEGLPVIAADSEGPGAILKSGSDGLLVPKSDASAMAAAIESLLADPRKALLLAQNARDTVRARYDLAVVGGKLDLAVRAVCRL